MKTISSLLATLVLATVCPDLAHAQILNYPRVDALNIPGVTRQIIMQPMPSAYPLPGVVVASNPQLQGSVGPVRSPAVVVTQPVAPVVYAVRPVDPEKAQADREEAERKAVIFQKQRASEDFAWAQYALGVRYLTGNGVGQDIDEGRKWLEKAAAQGDTLAKRKLEELKRVTRRAERIVEQAQKAQEAEKSE